MNVQTIGKTMPNGFAGSYARQPDMIVTTSPLGGEVPVAFGTPMKRNKNQVVPMGEGSTAAEFVGVAARQMKSQLSYGNQSVGQYAPNDPVSLFQRGSIQVVCQRGTPSAGGKVYVRVTANPSYSTAVVGGFEALEDSGNCVLLEHCQWGGGVDGCNVAELVILNRQNV